MHLDRLLEMLTQDLKLEAVPLKDKGGIHRLKLRPDLQIGIQDIEPGIYFSSLLMQMPKEENKEALFIYLMQANLLGQGTGGGVIGIDPTGSFLTLSLPLPVEVNYGTFKNRLEDFVNYLQFWRNEVIEFQKKII